MNTQFLKQFPFIRLLLPFASGIIFRLYVPVEGTIFLILCITTSFVCFCFTCIKSLSQNYSFRWIYGLFLMIALGSLGIYLADNKLTGPDTTLNEQPRAYTFAGLIEGPTEEHAKSIAAIISTRIKKDSIPEICKERLLVYFEKDSVSKTLKEGDMVIFRTVISEIERSGNPHEFDFKTYLLYKGIRFSGYVNQKSWQRLSENNLPFFMGIACKLRGNLKQLFIDLGLKGDELGVANALSIGDKTYLSSEIKQAYIASGTMHILAVSGMHVMLLYWVLNIIFSSLRFLPYGSLLWLILILLSIWFYALITGLAPSVSRASVMASLLAIGRVIHRDVNIFNPLAASAFILLLLNPLDLFDAGFQLSYAAVASIVIFNRYFQSWIQTKNWVVVPVWNIVTVTLAAQIFTVPLSIYYFHQFPNLFLVSNLIMIPLSTLIMYSTLLLIPFSAEPWLLHSIGKLYEGMIWLLNKTVSTIESLPIALTRHLYLDKLEIVSLYLIIIFLTLFFIKKKAVWIIACLSVLLVFSTNAMVKRITDMRKVEITIFHDHQKSIILFRNGTSGTWVVEKKERALMKYLESAIYADHIKENEILETTNQTIKEKYFKSGLWVHGNFCVFSGKTLYISKGEPSDSILPKVDFILFQPKQIRSCYLDTGRKVILDPGLQGYKKRSVEKMLADKRIPVYDMDRSGALVVRCEPFTPAPRFPVAQSRALQ